MAQDYTLTIRVINSILTSTGVLPAVSNDLCGDSRYVPFVSCYYDGRYNIHNVTVNITSTDVGTGKLCDVPENMDRAVFMGEFFLNDPNMHIKDDIGSLFRFSMGFMVHLYINAKGVYGTLPLTPNFMTLETLVIYASLTGELPSRYGNAKTVDLYGNSLEKVDALFLGKIETLNVSHNKISFIKDFWRNYYPRRFVTIDLSYNELTTLGVERSTMQSGVSTPNLVFLNLSHNKLQGTLAGEPFNFVLETFDASHNKIESPFPDVTNATLLRYFNVADNSLEGQLTGNALSLPSLEVFHAERNSLTGPIGSIASRNIKVFDVHDNKFSGNFPAELAQMSRMEHLDLSGNPELGGTLNVNANVFANVEVLNVGRTAIDLTIPASFLVNSKLRHFSVANAGTFTITGVPADAQLPNVLSDTLETLDLTGAGLTGPLPPEWADKPNLKEVNLVGNTITGCAPDVWTKHSALNAAYQGLKQTSDVRLCGGADAKETEKSGSNTGLIVGLSVGIGAVVLLVAILVPVFLCCRRKKKKQEAPPPGEDNDKDTGGGRTAGDLSENPLNCAPSGANLRESENLSYYDWGSNSDVSSV
ncbi:hypothetical protein, conserved [Angomonas deanei]|uniref:Uncharacterized protein n=1 Tax=Angomonas deanei TaxID=59799 RepID=A0A7G2CBU5_9TRYP|nr:hypothetical protein, conserved [Angomonas deanei]